MGDSLISWLSPFIPASSTISGFPIFAAVLPRRSQPSVSARYSRSRGNLGVGHKHARLRQYVRPSRSV
jgi:hypothetical protein